MNKPNRALYAAREKMRRAREWWSVAKAVVWNRGILLAWYRLWIRRNENHKSLNADYDAMRVMDGEEIRKYTSDLARRRDIAHKRDLNRLRKI